MPQSRLASDLTLPSGDTIPKLIYGTARKCERTSNLVYAALKAGFRALDTGQSEHYSEASVGDGFHRALSDGTVSNGGVFIQTKLPVDITPSESGTSLLPSRDIPLCIADSLALRRHPAYLDAYLLHHPLTTIDATLSAWDAMTPYVPSRIRHLGISNVTLPTLRALWDRAAIKPSIVQNAFHAGTGFDVELRRFCRERGIVYQAFWTITANGALRRERPVVDVAGKVGVTKVVALLALVLALGVCVLDGTGSEEHMVGDLEGVDRVGVWAEGEGALEWGVALEGFRRVVGDVS